MSMSYISSIIPKSVRNDTEIQSIISKFIFSESEDNEETFIKVIKPRVASKVYKSVELYGTGVLLAILIAVFLLVSYIPINKLYAEMMGMSITLGLLVVYAVVLRKLLILREEKAYIISKALYLESVRAMESKGKGLY